MATKGEVKARYIALLQSTYPFYTDGSRALETAHLAVNAALAGQMTLRGDCWEKALTESGLRKNATRTEISQLAE